VTRTDGATTETTYVPQKHPVSMVEVQEWLQSHGFIIERLHGDRDGSPYRETSRRAIIWAQKN
jgi:hypothetical protein